MIKGHAKIELKDEVTGEVTVAEQDNMVTNALAELANPLIGVNGLSGLLSYSEIPSIAQSLFGGVMLFEEPLSTDPDDFIWPFANPCTGFASNIAYSGTNLKMGGYNSAESGWQEDGSYKHVWDFATDSGNGTIASLGLTSAYSARIGLGSLVYNFGVSFPYSAFYQEELTSKQTYYQVYAPIYISDGYVYWVPTYNFTGSSHVYNNGGVFTIYKTAAPVEKVGLTTGILNVGRSEVFNLQLPGDFVSQFTSTSASEHAMSIHCKDGIVTLAYIAHGGTLAAGATRKLCHINLNDNMSMETTTFTNTTGEGIYFTQYKTSQTIVATRDYCIVVGSTSRNLYVVNTNDCTDIKRVHLPNGEIIAISSTYNLANVICQNGSAIAIHVSPNSSTDIPFALAINLDTGEASYLNISGAQTNRISVTQVTYGSGLLGLCSYGTSQYLKTFVNPFFLTTKNNLDAPVTKTATQSMKITYTLREG